MIHGEYIVNGIVVPNQLTIFGAQAIFRAAFWGETQDWEVGLCSRIPADLLLIGNMNEPGATGGYARQPIPLGNPSWPTIGLVNNETYAETAAVVFPCTEPYDTEVSRLFITDGTNVISVSSPIPGGLQIIEAELTTKYRIFLR